MDTLIAVLAILIIVALAAGYIYQQKKKGSKCIGCPYGASCARKASGCGCDKSETE